MATLTDLHRAVQKTLAEKHVGKPVFVRYTAQVGAGLQSSARKLAELANLIRGWVGQTLEQVHATGAAAKGPIALTLIFHEGATALVSLVPHLPGDAAVDLMIFGNHGAIYHEACGADFLDDTPAETAVDAGIQAAITRALSSGKPEAVEAEAKP
jgi:hypothetical protein